ncbi:MAG: ATP-binding protein [Clostridia bacterium]|nr:ATP-binding protein [Clostridia bacterium]
MDKLILQDVLEAYAAKRSHHAAQEEKRRAEIAEKCPDVQQLVDKRHQMVMASVRSIFAGGGQDMVQQMEQYNQAVAKALESHGYPRDYLSPILDCPLCEDTGYVYENGLKTPCKCLKAACEQAAREADKAADGVSFAAFDPLRFPKTMLPGTDITQREYMLLLKEKCRSFVRQVQGGPVQTLLLHGGSGLGKTYLLQCIRREAAALGIRCAFVTAYDVLDALRNAYFGRENDTADLCMNADLLLIDDLGMEPLMENVTVEQIYHLLSSRLSRGLYTAVSTNLSLVELKKRYTERVTSRLLDVRTGMDLPFLGSDIRLKK